MAKTDRLSRRHQMNGRSPSQNSTISVQKSSFSIQNPSFSIQNPSFSIKNVYRPCIEAGSVDNHIHVVLQSVLCSHKQSLRNVPEIKSCCQIAREPTSDRPLPRDLLQPAGVVHQLHLVAPKSSISGKNLDFLLKEESS